MVRNSQGKELSIHLPSGILWLSGLIWEHLASLHIKRKVSSEVLLPNPHILPHHWSGEPPKSLHESTLLQPYSGRQCFPQMNQGTLEKSS